MKTKAPGASAFESAETAEAPLRNHAVHIRPLVAQLIRDLPLFLLALLVFVLPLFRTGALEDSFITPKLALVQLFLFGVLATLAPRVFRRDDAPDSDEDLGRYSLQVPLALIAFLLVFALSVFYAPSHSQAQHALAYFSSFVALYVVCLLALGDAPSVSAVMLSGVAAATVTAGWTLAEDLLRGGGASAVVARLPDWRGYLAAGLGNSGHIAGFIGLFLPAAIVMLLVAPAVQVWLAGWICLMFGALVVTWSVGSTGSLVCSLLAWTLIARRTRARTELRWGRLGFIVLAGALIAAFYLVPHPLNPHKPSLWQEAFSSQRWHEGGETRRAIWATTWQVVKAHPWLGVGVGNFTYAYVQQTNPDAASDPVLGKYAGSYTNEAHNEYLQVWCEGGIVALALYVMVFALWFRRLRVVWGGSSSPSQRALLLSCGAGVTVFLLDSLMSFPLRLPAHIGSLMFLLAVPEAVTVSGRMTVSAPVKRGLCRALWVLSLVLLLSSSWLHAKRVAAEVFLKRARQSAEGAILFPDGSSVSPWRAAEGLFAQGSQSLAAGDREGAAKAFGQAKRLASAVTMDEADRHFRRSLEWDPDYTNASSRYGAFLLMRGDCEEAIRVLQGTLRGLETYEVHERLGFAWYLMPEQTERSMQEAAAHWSTCLDRRPQFGDYYRGLLRQIDQDGH